MLPFHTIYSRVNSSFENVRCGPFVVVLLHVLIQFLYLYLYFYFSKISAKDKVVENIYNFQFESPIEVYQ